MELSFKQAYSVTIGVAQCSIGPSVGLTLLLVQTHALGKFTADGFGTGTVELVEDMGAPEVPDESCNGDDVWDASLMKRRQGENHELCWDANEDTLALQ